MADPWSSDRWSSDAPPEAVIAAARAWVGTPYRHGGARRGVGCDCLGLVRGVYAEVTGVEPPAPPPYAPSWAELRADEPLLDAAHALLRPAPALPGTVLVFRWSAGGAAKHCGVLVAPDRFVHAYSGIGAVESPLAPAWRRRIVGSFAFPSADPSHGSASWPR